MSKCLVNTFISGTKADIKGASVLNSNRSQTLLSPKVYKTGLLKLRQEEEVCKLLLPGSLKASPLKFYRVPKGKDIVFQTIMAFKGLY